MFKYKNTLLFVVVLILTACGGGSSSQGGGNVSLNAADGDAAQGKALYEGMVVGSNSVPGCVTCHSLELGVTLVGPSHAGLATRATETIKSANYRGNAKTVEEYLVESVVEPNVYIEKGFSPSVMYQNYGQDLNQQEISDIVAFMLTLK
jgi:nitric oxide reductase subunit C